MIIISIEIDEIGCPNFPDLLLATVNIPPPDNLLAKHVNKNGTIEAFRVNTDYVYFDCFCCNQTHYPNTYIEGNIGISFVKNEDEDSNENENSDENDEYDVLRNELETINLSLDDHWNCYCKKRKVCGCGCDPLHDGW
jgi:hypothetical protein